jgi:hypothetical protein
MQRSLAVGIDRIHISTGCEQYSRAFRTPIFGGSKYGRFGSFSILFFQIGASFNYGGKTNGLATTTSAIQSRTSTRIDAIDIGAFGKQFPNGFIIAALRGRAQCLSHSRAKKQGCCVSSHSTMTY